jgi:hypothetical protein
MQRVLSNLNVVSYALKHFKFSKHGIIEQELISSLVQSLAKVKASNFATKLVIKHAIMIDVMRNFKDFLQTKNSFIKCAS